ncbi:MAG: response regulator, partial [Alkalimonas sp.]|nr:response regulator [Alkalimonas sp.]
MVPETNTNDFLFLADDVEPTEPLDFSRGEWHVLIVDDDDEIHTVTKLALSDVVVEGKRLNFHHSYSGSEAVEFLKAHQNIALVLLDVVMETDDAGLKVVEKIRNELGLEDTRIILRTGQPGYAPEESVIKEY